MAAIRTRSDANVLAAPHLGRAPAHADRCMSRSVARDFSARARTSRSSLDSCSNDREIYIASPSRLEMPIRAVSCPAPLEPGILGVSRPVLLLPEGIFHRLTSAQQHAVIAHEHSHVRHRDRGDSYVRRNSLPLVSWIGKRMLEDKAQDGRDYYRVDDERTMTWSTNSRPAKLTMPMMPAQSAPFSPFSWHDTLHAPRCRGLPRPHLC